MSKKGTLIVYSGPSGVGKGTILKPYLKSHPNAVLSVSATTRKPRPGETHGVEYYFITGEEFQQMVRDKGLLEYTQYNGNYYGTPRAAVEEQIALGRDVVLEIEVQGAMQVKLSYPDAVFIFVLPPSYADLKTRLAGRGTEPPEVVEARLHAARFELSCAPEYDYIVVNDSADAAREKLGAIITAAKCQTKYMQDYIRKVSEMI